MREVASIQSNERIDLAGDDARRARWRLHRMLIRRIAGVAVVIAAALAALVYFLEQARMREMAVDLAAHRAAQFSAVAEDVLAMPAAQHSEVQDRLDRFAAGRLPRREGGIVAATIYAVDGNAVARFVSPDYAHRNGVVSFLANQRPTVDAGTESAGRAVDIAGARHFFVQLPMHDGQARALGQLLAVFAPSATYLAELRARVWRTTGAAILVVLVTAGLLYPVIVRLMRRVTTLSGDLLDANLEMLSALGSAIAKRDADTDAHNYRVTIYSVKLAQAAGLDVPRIQALIKGAFLHDVGKIATPDRILLKPGKLDDQEFAEMKKHVAHGLDIVRRSAWLVDAEAVVGYHHEKYDGSGYDAQLQADAIPMVARIFAIADVFDALTSRRPYKEPLAFEASMEILERGRGTHFDPRLLDVFIGIARSLHATFANRDDDRLRQELRQVVRRYFTRDLDGLLR
jgi:HD-GYP domain-containing protein (c-di-GMP phosphodiesterase class II)